MTQAASSQSSRLQALRDKHANLSRQIDQIRKYPAANDLYLRRMKIEKLRIKDEIEDAHARA
jgi:hypothetical protein